MQPKTNSVSHTAAPTFAEIYTSPQVVEVSLPNLHIICCLNETCIQRLLKNICEEDKEDA